VPLLGQLALWLALLLGVWGVALGFGGSGHDRPDLEESARRATVALVGALLVAVAALVVAVLRRDFRVAYVAAHADRTLASRDTWGVLLDGIEGRLLVGAAAVAVCLTVARHFAGGSDRRVLGYAVALTSGVVALGVVVLLLAANPFGLLSYTPVDGQGLSQRLQSFATQLYVAFLWFGGAAVVVTVTRTLAARLAAHRANDWDRATHLWLSVASVLVTLGVTLGLWADYHERGWSGAWLGDVLRSITLPAWGVLTLLAHAGKHSARRMGTRIARAGGALVACGLIGAAFRTTVDAELRPGEAAVVGRYSLTYLAASVYPVGNQIVTHALVEVRRAGVTVGRLAPRLRQQVTVFGNARFAPMPHAGVRSGLLEDVHALLLAAPPGPEPAAFRFAINPLGCWLWVGMWLIVAGGVMTLWPGRIRG
jgi:cytochrome c biogenesis factor